MVGSNEKIKVFVAMSGGVDSSVSAALLKKAGFSVTGVYMKQWAPSVLGANCPWKQERQDALRVCAQLGIPFLTWDFSKEYEEEVGKYMVDSYKKGITPNPDIMCNKVIKFGLFYDKAMKEGADYVATGHYAGTSLQDSLLGVRLSARQQAFFPGIASLRGHPPRKKSLLPRSVKLLKAKDQNKDQTYFLYELKKGQLGKILFPLGGVEKPEVRKLAKKLKLHNAEKKDSQGVCFVGQFNMKSFLKEYIAPKKGRILDVRGKEIGMHDGSYYYTIGQRHGLDIKNGQGPYFVVKKDVKKNIVWVGEKKDLLKTSIKLKNIHWIEKPAKFPVVVQARIRYRAPLGKAFLQKNGVLEFSKPQVGVAPGQSAVFYRGKVVLGGGVIV